MPNPELNMNMFFEYLDSSILCPQILNFTIQKIICGEQIFDMKTTVFEENLRNITRDECGYYALDTCMYDVREPNAELLYCDVILEDAANDLVFGSRQIWFKILL